MKTENSSLKRGSRDTARRVRNIHDVNFCIGGHGMPCPYKLMLLSVLCHLSSVLCTLTLLLLYNYLTFNYIDALCRLLDTTAGQVIVFGRTLWCGQYVVHGSLVAVEHHSHL